MIKELNRDVVRALRVDIDAALKAVAEKHGLVYRPGRGSLTNLEATLPATFAIKSESGEDLSAPARDRWRTFAPGIGLSADLFGRSIRYKGDVYQIIDINTRARKAPVVSRCLRPGGKNYRFPANLVNASTLVAEERKVEAPFTMPNTVAGDGW